ncbi:hypothetical protein DKZ22_12205 [Limosilactobacillus reuteri]|uniref:Uncharacterized protein n=2 Tax=Limosilactobacillus reuteri TaxID=1598 RepID=A0A855XYL1_LIMRT|nr:hypothetical protein [Limosilactobacillus reuteri]PWT35191.1 hypothetical protein DKZ24_05025 [Limosilactobacillus reuteri]PWT38882.1 hypothetical protein DKZ22_12205 [Limosilactobacillus reuteri]PWT53605.1 hypothetical protein DKZ31_07970 [Limosilactobacillus reuteri]PWT59809.1 hypothetical protein DKZ30_04980 [Limosilactobacillus reuteri]PWT64509.1 hypothetical protein DKZ20_05065 [Limosilactobacillus reuteri]
MAFEVPHKHDISLDGQDMRNQMIENFKAIEQEDHDDDQALSDEVADRKKGDDAEKAARQSADDEFEKRIKKLEDNSATHDEVTEAREFMNDKAERVVLGTDLSTVKRAVEMILKNEGVI